MRFLSRLALLSLALTFLTTASIAYGQTNFNSPFGNNQRFGTNNRSLPPTGFNNDFNSRGSGFNGGRTPGNLPASSDFYRRPTTSPYLGLLRRNSNGGLNYFTQVRPEVQFREAARQQEQAIQRLNREARALGEQQRALTYRDPTQVIPSNPLTGANRGLRPTGLPTTFGNTMGRFPGLP